MSEEWGPWIEHDGEGCPVHVGSIVHVVLNEPIVLPTTTDGLIATGHGWAIYYLKEPATPNGSWFWGYRPPVKRRCDGYAWVMRYRIRKPHGLIILESLLIDLPETVDA